MAPRDPLSTGGLPAGDAVTELSGADVRAAAGGAAGPAGQQAAGAPRGVGRTIAAPAAPEPGWSEPVGSRTPNLRRLLVCLDAAAAMVAWALAVGRTDLDPIAATAVFAAGSALSIALIASNRLYWARVCAVRAIETAKLGRISAMTGLALYAGAEVVGVPLGAGTAATGAVLSFVALVSVRGGYRNWLSAKRRRGRFMRPVVVVGANEEGFDLYRLIEDHPELGFRVCGVIGRPSDYQGWDFDVPLVGEPEHALEAVRAVGANGALVAATAVPTGRLNRLVRTLLDAGVHVHLSSGLRGIAHHRLKAIPLAHEPVLYLEHTSLSPWQLTVKRGLDLVLGTLAGIVALPVLVVSALAVRLGDGGPAFFRQERVGRGGATFTVYKLRTMVVGADRLQQDLNEHNDRSGPLFKLAQDPRVTPLGRLLRATSIDELPQLWNVLRGDMSLVGPRPALPAEVAQFDEDLQARDRVTPGITGLWQVEARDNPSFGAYQRLDLFYVENWSVGLDLAILLSTVRVVTLRSLRAVLPRLTPPTGDAVLD